MESGAARVARLLCGGGAPADVARSAHARLLALFDECVDAERAVAASVRLARYQLVLRHELEPFVLRCAVVCENAYADFARKAKDKFSESGAAVVSVVRGRAAATGLTTSRMSCFPHRALQLRGLCGSSVCPSRVPMVTDPEVRPESCLRGPPAPTPHTRALSPPPHPPSGDLQSPGGLHRLCAAIDELEVSARASLELLRCIGAASAASDAAFEYALEVVTSSAKASPTDPNSAAFLAGFDAYVLAMCRVQNVASVSQRASCDLCGSCCACAASRLL